MKILHLELKKNDDNSAQLRYFWDNPNQFETRQLDTSDIQEKRKEASRNYYTHLKDNNAVTGIGLYNWLDGENRFLDSALSKYKKEGVILAISALEGLAYLPWEVLHDGQQFLVERIPAVVPVRWMGNAPLTPSTESPANRAMNLLFMATSPHGIKPDLDYEIEEGRILDATKRQPLNLIVEESGCLSELGYLIEGREENYFDVIHITGHATVRDEIPYFITETLYGEAKYSNAKDIAEELQFQHPKLLFLSGCRTGYNPKEGTIASMAEELLNLGATSVLGWGERVLDPDATTAAAALYQELSIGKTVSEALAATYQSLIKEEVQDWQLLRLYVGEILPGSLVRRGRKPAVRRSATSKFLDREGRVRVATRENFVGRRRQLQNCLRTLRTDYEKFGIVIHGFGGLGKSTIAARLCDRMPDHKKLVWWRQVDSDSFINDLTDQLRSSVQRELLRDSSDELKYRLRNLFDELNGLGQESFLLIFDDFEWNLEHRDGRYILKSKVAKFLSDLVWAIRESNSYHRILITCRYEFQSGVMNSFYVQGLDSFRNSDLKKKLRQLSYFNAEDISKDLVERALLLAAGNPRLLEFLNDKVLSRKNAEEKLQRLEYSPADWKEQVIWPELYEQIDSSIEKVLSYCLVFEIPAPLAALEAVCSALPFHQKQISRAIELGLIEVSSDFEESDRTYRVSRILTHLIPNIQPPKAPLLYELCQNGAEKLLSLWANKDNRNRAQWQETFRLLFADKETPSRFRKGFSKMLSVQFNAESDSAFETELRNTKEDLEMEISSADLDEYLYNRQWLKADEETVWILYQLMILGNYRDWDALLKNMPVDIFTALNHLWVEYSGGHFGFSVQKDIWVSLGGSSTANQATWKAFRTEVGWYLSNEDGWLPCSEIDFDLEKTKRGSLPTLWAVKTNFSTGAGAGFRRQSAWFSASFIHMMSVADE